MPKCIIDDREVEFEPGQNLVEIAKKLDEEIPIFCYHPGLTVVAQCRMCQVEVEGMPKLQTACSTEAREGMVVRTKSPAVKKAQESVMEMLLINHPLDCPICDKSGECDLQDHSYDYGSQYMRYTEERRRYLDLDMGPVIKKNMNRCIHCTRCIRFGDEVANIREMVAMKRGNNTEITTLNGRALETEYAGNYSDICPTGSLTLKDFRFHKRAWMLKKTSTVCEGCSRGCNMEIQEDRDVIYRCIPVENMEVNRYWMCDEGRFNYHYVGDKSRINTPRIGKESSDWKQTLAKATQVLSGAKSVSVLVGSDLTLEEAQQIQKWAGESLKNAKIVHFGTPGINSSDQDGHEDEILRMKSKTSNLHGMEKLGIQSMGAQAPQSDVTVVFRGGRAFLPDLKNTKAVGIGVFFDTEPQSFEAILPGLSFAEKSGTIVNFEGREQKLQKAINAPSTCRGLDWTLQELMKSSSTGESA